MKLSKKIKPINRETLWRLDNNINPTQSTKESLERVSESYKKELSLVLEDYNIETLKLNVLEMIEFSHFNYKEVENFIKSTTMDNYCLDKKVAIELLHYYKHYIESSDFEFSFKSERENIYYTQLELNKRIMQLTKILK